MSSISSIGSAGWYAYLDAIKASKSVPTVSAETWMKFAYEIANSTEPFESLILTKTIQVSVSNGEMLVKHHVELTASAVDSSVIELIPCKGISDGRYAFIMHLDFWDNLRNTIRNSDYFDDEAMLRLELALSSAGYLLNIHFNPLRIKEIN